MDSKVPSDKVTQELARELLIAISYSVPDTNLNADGAPKNVDGANGAVVAKADEAEKYRSALISISDAQSPDALVPPDQLCLGTIFSRKLKALLYLHLLYNKAGQEENKCDLNKDQEHRQQKQSLKSIEIKKMIKIKSEIVSRQTIKPSTPTPPHLKTFKMSLLDQISPGIHGNMTFFFPSNTTTGSISDDFSEKSKLLQDSISRTLSVFYPLGGRLVDAATIDCNDEGAFYIEAKVNIQLSEILNQPEFSLMDHFLPTTDPKTMELSNGAMFLVQFTSFTCGGVAISLSLTHKLADVSALLTLLSSWSSICRGESDPLVPDLVGEKFLAPRDELSAMSASLNINAAEKFSLRRFVFSAEKIAELKAKVGPKFREALQSHPSRVEVVLALLWKCAVANKKLKKGSFGPTVLFQAVNLRKRMSPPLPETAIGNFIWPFMVVANEEKDLDLDELVIRMRKSFNEFNSTKANMFRGEEAPMSIMAALKERGEFLRNNREMTVYKCSSWCKFPLYDTDFGWGKPLWHVSVNKLVTNTIALADTRSRDGIEALFTLDDEEMALFEQNEELLKYATLNPSVYA
ncbi:hypothetical protein PTKIN_Ptkin05aG0015400 [Pterospermum kingtungense]